jgi:hypothetical protein
LWRGCIEIVKALTLLALLLAACSADSSTVAQPQSTGAKASSPAPTSRPSATPVAGCEPTRTRDVSGVITSDGRTGIVGETFAVGDLLSGGPHIVRRATIPGDQISLRFDRIDVTAPATKVFYGATATALATGWGDAAFQFGWKPIAFEDSCWRLIVDELDTGIVLAIGH